MNILMLTFCFQQWVNTGVRSSFRLSWTTRVWAGWFTKPKTKGTKIGQLIKAVDIFIIPFSYCTLFANASGSEKSPMCPVAPVCSAWACPGEWLMAISPVLWGGCPAPCKAGLLQLCPHAQRCCNHFHSVTSAFFPVLLQSLFLSV